MSKYGNLRPAGMSDEEDNDDDYFFEEDIRERNSPQRENLLRNNFDDALFNEERTHEDDVMKACSAGDLKILQNHFQNPLDKICDINKILHTGWTLLLYAASSVQPAVVECLLTFDADPNKSKEGFTPLMALCNSVKGTPEASLKCLVLLLQAKADPNLTDKRRETALMYACASHNAEFVTKLIKHVNDINACDSDGKAALSYAAAANKPDVVKILLEHNADTSLMDKDYVSAKDIADKKGYEEISALLTMEEEREIPSTCEVFDRKTWKDLFPDLYPRKKEGVLDDYVINMLYGMGLESYSSQFQGMDLTTFLQLTEDDIRQLGVDITVHREQFVESLEKFHLKEWNRSVSILSKNQNSIDACSVYDNVLALGYAKEKIAAIGASFQYIKNNLMRAAGENIYLSPSEILKYEEELKETQKNLKNLKNEIIRMRKLAQKIDKEDDIGVPPTYISPKKNNSNWTISLSIALMAGLYLCKTTYTQKLWNIFNT